MERSIWNRATSDREIPLGSGLAAISERLLLAHARGEILFIAGAGIFQPASLPDFLGLVLRVYAQLEPVVYAVISTVPHRVQRPGVPVQRGEHSV